MLVNSGLTRIDCANSIHAARIVRIVETHVINRPAGIAQFSDHCGGCRYDVKQKIAPTHARSMRYIGTSWRAMSGAFAATAE